MLLMSEVIAGISKSFPTWSHAENVNVSSAHLLSSVTLTWLILYSCLVLAVVDKPSLSCLQSEQQLEMTTDFSLQF